MNLRNLDTMDARDWIILRLLKLCAESMAHKHPDFSKAALWVANNIDIWHPSKVPETLHATLRHETTQDLYIAQQWMQPTDLDGLVPFEALLVSVQTNDAELT